MLQHMLVCLVVIFSRMKLELGVNDFLVQHLPQPRNPGGSGEFAHHAQNSGDAFGVLLKHGQNRDRLLAETGC